MSTSRLSICLLAALVSAGGAIAVSAAPQPERPQDVSASMNASRPDGTPLRPVATYSIVARDGRSGEMGVAVQSHWFSVGSVVPWAKAGVGAVATQSFVNPAYGPEGLRLMAEGASASEALRRIREEDPGRDFRQVGFVDASGDGAAFTGDRCIIHAADQKINLPGGSVVLTMANMMERQFAPEAMLRGYSRAQDEPLAERLLSALEGAQRAGGDIRGKQSASLLVVRGESTGDPWRDVVVELRVEDHHAPVEELRRLLTLHRAYEHMNNGDVAMEEGDIELALQEYNAARELAPDNAEMAFWTAVSLVNADRIDDAKPYFNQAFADDTGNWRELLRRLPASGLFPDDEKLIDQVLEGDTD